jgi:LemA protein
LAASSQSRRHTRSFASFTQLQAELSNTEDQIAGARRLYNGNVQAYLTKIQQFPGALVAGPFNFGERDYFELDEPADREPVKVDFSS